MKKSTTEEWINTKISDTLTNLIKLSKEKRNLISKLKENTFWLTYFEGNCKKNIILKFAFQENIFLLELYTFGERGLKIVGSSVKRFVKRMIK